MKYSYRSLVLGLLLTVVSGCQGPQIGEQYTVYTPIFADNRVYHLAQPETTGDHSQLQALEALGENVSAADPDVVQANQPLSIIMRSVEIPAYDQKGPISRQADYVVILDIGTAIDGSTQSLVVWYQRGVQADQSLNFSNLLVYFEPRWDQRVAPFFRVRVMDITKERNTETRKALDRVQSIATVVSAFATAPEAAPLIGIAFTAADLVLANNQNRMVLDYSVQLYSSAAQAQAGSGRLGALKKGSYIVVGRPNNESRTFWKEKFWFDPDSRQLTSTGPVNVPTALITVGTFDSIVPKLVLERSAALTKLLSDDPGKSSVELIDESASRLEASVHGYVLGEKLTRYRDTQTVADILSWTGSEETKALLGSEDIFFLTRSLSACLRPDQPFTTLAEATEYVAQHRNVPCSAAK